MRLFAQTSAVITTLILFSFGTALITRQAIVLPQLRELEAQADRKDLRRVLLAIDAKKQQLAALTYKNAIWDDMYRYVEQRDTQFLDSNFPIDTFVSLNIGLIAIFDRDGRLVEQRIANQQQSAFVYTELPLAEIQPRLIDLSNVLPRAPIFDSGLMATALGPLLYAEASIMRSDTNSDAAGTLLIATAVDDEFIHEIEETAQLNIALHVLPENYQSAQPQTLDQVRRDDTDRLFWILSDNHSRPVLRLTLQLPPRDFDTQLLWVPLLMAFLVSMIGYACILILVQRLLIRPIHNIGTHLQRVQQHGNYGLRLDSALGNELGDLSRGIDTLVQHVQKQQEQLQQQTAEMQALSYQDGLTALANRRRFDQALTDNWALAQRAHTPLALLMCDVDYFKPFNDHYGHQRGDEVLKRVAEIIQSVVVRHSDLAARYGGEEFAVLLPDTGEDGAQRIAQRIQEELRAAAIEHEYSAISRRLTISIGVASLVPSTAQNPRDLVMRADEALYSSKAAGRDRITLASELLAG
jgi:diguanylate cyclase (GGDEF)-like protein